MNFIRPVPKKEIIALAEPALKITDQGSYDSILEHRWWLMVDQSTHLTLSEFLLLLYAYDVDLYCKFTNTHKDSLPA